jgi:hypothetical protein
MKKTGLEILENLRNVLGKIPVMICTPQMQAWAQAKAREEEEINRKRRFEELGANPDGSTRNVPTDLSAERLAEFFQRLSAESAKYRAKSKRTKRNGRKGTG